MQDLNIEAVRAQLQAASPAPWNLMYNDLTEVWEIRTGAQGSIIDCLGHNRQANAELITAAPNIMATLLDKVESLEQLVEIKSRFVGSFAGARDEWKQYWVARDQAVRELHKPMPFYCHPDDCPCTDKDTHDTGETSDGDEVCWDSPTGEQACTECSDARDEPAAYPCATIKALDETEPVQPSKLAD